MVDSNSLRRWENCSNMR